MNDLAFIVPVTSAFTSGGNVYNRSLIDALRTCGLKVHEGVFSQSSAIAEGAIPHVVDSIYFEQIRKTGWSCPSPAISLIHHLSCLYPYSLERYYTHSRPVLEHFDAHIVTSHFTRRFLIDQGIRADSIVVVEPAAPTVSRDERRFAEKIRALLVASVIPRKGILPFLEELSHRQLPPFYEIRIVGSTSADTDYACKCLDLVTSSGTLSRTVKFLGEQDGQAVDRLFQRSNLFISTSFMETFGMAIQEAVVYGLPVLVLEGGNSAFHVTPGQNGWSADSITSLTDIFESLTHDADLLRRYNSTASNHEPDYSRSWKDQAKLVIDFCRDKGFLNS